MKRWNREKELLADGAEKASVAASWLGARPTQCPAEQRLDADHGLALPRSARDVHPKAYTYSWNDDIIAMNQFAAV